MNLGTPWMLFGLPLVALVGWLMARARRLERDAACRLKGVAPDGASARLTRRDRLALSALTLVVLALARPQWNPRPYDVERRARDLVIALDVSRSMLAADVFPSRLEAARIAIHEALPAFAGQRIALITFAGSAAVRVPLTLDHAFVRYMLDRADPSDAEVGSTSLEAAVEKAVSAVLADSTGGQRDLVVFTDGEDHLSDRDKTAEMLAGCGARVLIIGLGDPVQGARVPAASGTEPWMQYNDVAVVSRLDESTLTRLSERSPNVICYPARTRPIDLVPLYRDMILRATGSTAVGGLREVRYTEGYPFLLGLAVILWLVFSLDRWPAVRALGVLALLLPGCGHRSDEGDALAFRAKFAEGSELMTHAEEQTAVDLAAARGLLVDAREAFLRAALLRPGDLESARSITFTTHRLREIDAAIEAQHAAEKKRAAKLGDIIAALEQLTSRQLSLARQSRQLLRRRLVQPGADLSKSGADVNEIDTIATADVGGKNERRAASTAAVEQQAVREATGEILDAVASQQDALRELLVRAYGDTGRQPPTELDPAADLLAGALAVQQQALEGLRPASLRWPAVNSAFHTAAGRMQQAIEALRSLQPPSTDEDDTSIPPGKDFEYEEPMEGSDSGADGKKFQPVSAGDFEAALALQALPVPNYTSAEIIAEEAANQQKRALQKAARAGARVEKNW
ncbi:MAG: VWA domain-containing protein [Planctomycetota bacterium]